MERERNGLCLNKRLCVLRRHVAQQGLLPQCSVPALGCIHSPPQICLEIATGAFRTCPSPTEAVLSRLPGLMCRDTTEIQAVSVMRAQQRASLGTEGYFPNFFQKEHVTLRVNRKCGTSKDNSVESRGGAQVGTVGQKGLS